MGAVQDLNFKCSFPVGNDGCNANPATIATCFTRPSLRYGYCVGSCTLLRFGSAFAAFCGALVALLRRLCSALAAPL